VHHSALPYSELPAFIAELAKREAVAALALRFAVLTAARTGEVIGATWSEIHGLDGKDPRWIIPAERMKMAREHTVPLSPQAVAILRQAADYGSKSYVFPSPDSIGTDNPLQMSNMAMLTLLRRLDADKRTTVHGLARGSFSTWGNEHAHARADVIEACLAHQERNAIRRAYNHASYLAERRELLQRWADYCDGKEPASNVVPMLKVA
jgi:integrase